MVWKADSGGPGPIAHSNRSTESMTMMRLSASVSDEISHPIHSTVSTPRTKTSEQMGAPLHRPRNSGKRSSLTTALASPALLLIAASCILLYTRTNPTEPAPSSPTVESINGARTISEIPTAAPKAVLFIAHGCSCRPENFWPASPRCPRCVGLPEDRAITARALARRFAVLAVASAEACWSLGEEVEAINRTIQSWTAKNRLDGLPVVALGASSGGYFVSRLAAGMRFAAVAIMIAEGAFGSTGAPAGYPPTMFVHMPKDRRRAALVESNAELLRRSGVDVRELRSLEFPLTPRLLSDRIPGLDPELSARVWAVLREKGFVDGRGYLRKDGRATPWKEAVMERRGLGEEASPWLEHIQEELNLAYAYHEMTSLPADEMFDWFEEHLS